MNKQKIFAIISSLVNLTLFFVMVLFLTSQIPVRIDIFKYYFSDMEFSLGSFDTGDLRLFIILFPIVAWFILYIVMKKGSKLSALRAINRCNIILFFLLIPLFVFIFVTARLTISTDMGMGLGVPMEFVEPMPWIQN